MGFESDPSSSSSLCAVLRLSHDLPVHPPRLQHLLPVILAAPDSPLQDKGFPSVRNPAVFPRRLCPRPVTRPQEHQVLLHFITGGILLGHFLPCLGAMQREGLGTGPKPPTQTFCQILTPREGIKKKKICSFSKQSSFLCNLPFSGSAPSLSNTNS